jgi:hypothetical protein
MRLSAPIYELKRRAKLLSRKAGIPLHKAQDQIARENGLASWSLLAFQHVRRPFEPNLLPRLENGDMLLIGARAGQGKTMLALQLLCDAVSEGRRAVFFTLEYSEREAADRLKSQMGAGAAAMPEIVASDDICAASIMRHLAGATIGTVAVIDYLQLLDQQRSKPALSEQLEDLQAFARQTGVIFAFISQIDRRFDPTENTVPGLGDMRLPNPASVDVFTKAWFLHGGEARLQ